MPPQRYGIFSGVRALIFCLLEKIYTGAKCRWSRRVDCVANVQNLQNIYYGSARWLETYGRYVKEKLECEELEQTNANGGQMVVKLTQQELEHQATVAWAIWNARNKFCFEKVKWHPEYILREVTGFLQEYQCLNATQVPGGRSFSNKTKARVEWCCYVLDQDLPFWMYCNAK